MFAVAVRGSVYAYHEHLHRRVGCNQAEEKAGENLRRSKDEIHVRRTFHRKQISFGSLICPEVILETNIIATAEL